MATVSAIRRPKTTTNSVARSRVDAVFIRKSGKQQEDDAQIANVKTMLKSRSVDVPDSQWFICTIGRRKVTKDPVFIRLIELLEDNKIRNVYIEDQKRWGTRNSPELFRYIAKFRENKSQLFDLRYNRNLAAEDVYSEIMAVVSSHASKVELQDLAFRPLRTKVNNLKQRGSWPSGVQPFGFGKRCYEADGKTILWEWYPVSDKKWGQQYYVDDKGKLKAGPSNVRLPKKLRGQITKLVPSRNKADVKVVQLAFDMFAHEGLSYRAMAMRLNDAGYSYYGKPFTFNHFHGLLENPAYIGHTYYGKNISGELGSFDSNGEMVERKEDEVEELPKSKRPIEDQIAIKDTHKGLIDPKTWEIAQVRLKELAVDRRHPPRKPEYYLKSVLVCGHCGKHMTGGTEGKGDNQVVTYFCSTYRSGKSNGQKVKCGAHRIRHDDAEALLFNKLKELDINHKRLTRTVTRGNIEDRLNEVESRDNINAEEEYKLITEGAKALRAYYMANYEPSPEQYEKFKDAARMQYQWWKTDRTLFTNQFRKLVREAEDDYVAKAKKKVAKMEREHAAFTKSWALADERQKDVLKGECHRLGEELTTWKPRTLSFSERLKELRKTGSELGEKYAALLIEWPAMKQREQGEALRRIFKAVKLKWKATFHPNEENPGRERKTNRKGRWSYELLENEIEWDLVDSELLRSS